MVHSDFGWGFRDSYFKVDLEKESIMMTGNRYSFAGKNMPNYGEFSMSVTGNDPRTLA
jgi:hypothetical protein